MLNSPNKEKNLENVSKRETRVPKLLKTRFQFENGEQVSHLLSDNYKSSTTNHNKSNMSFNDEFDLLKKEQLLDHDFMNLMKKKDTQGNQYKKRFDYANSLK